MKEMISTGLSFAIFILLLSSGFSADAPVIKPNSSHGGVTVPANAVTSETTLIVDINKPVVIFEKDGLDRKLILDSLRLNKIEPGRNGNLEPEFQFQFKVLTKTGEKLAAPGMMSLGDKPFTVAINDDKNHQGCSIDVTAKLLGIDQYPDNARVQLKIKMSSW